MWLATSNVVDKFWSSQLQMSIFISVFISDSPFGMIQLTNVHSSEAKKFFKELADILVQKFFLVLVGSNFSLELIDMFFAFLFFDFGKFFLLSFKGQVRLINCQIGFDSLGIGDKAFEFLLIVWVIFKPMSEVLDGLRGLLSVDAGKALGDDFPDFILLEVGEGLLIHEMVWMLCLSYESYILCIFFFIIFDWTWSVSFQLRF